MDGVDRGLCSRDMGALGPPVVILVDVLVMLGVVSVSLDRVISTLLLLVEATLAIGNVGDVGNISNITRSDKVGGGWGDMGDSLGRCGVVRDAPLHMAGELLIAAVVDAESLMTYAYMLHHGHALGDELVVITMEMMDVMDKGGGVDVVR